MQVGSFAIIIIVISAARHIPCWTYAYPVDIQLLRWSIKHIIKTEIIFVKLYDISLILVYYPSLYYIESM